MIRHISTGICDRCGATTVSPPSSGSPVGWYYDKGLLVKVCLPVGTVGYAATYDLCPACSALLQKYAQKFMRPSKCPTKR